MSKVEFGNTPLLEPIPAVNLNGDSNSGPDEIERELTIGEIGMHKSVLSNLGKTRHKRHFLLASLILSDCLAIVAAFLIASLLRIGFLEWTQLSPILLTIVPIHVAIAMNNKSYQANALSHRWKSVSRGLSAFLLAAISLLLILFMFKTSSDFSRLLFGIGTALAVFFIVSGRMLFIRLSKYWIGPNPYADLCIYDNVPYTDNSSTTSISAKDFGLNANPSDITAVRSLGELVSGMDRVVIHCSAEQRSNWVFMLRSLDISSEIVVPELDIVHPLAITRRGDRTSLLISLGQLRWDQKLTKRAFDLVAVIVSLPITLPLIIFAAIAIKIESRGPVFFKQERIGLGNRPFNIWKLSSMRTEKHDHAGNRSTARDDDRITKVGSFIRKTSIDELPQVLNVLVGDMSIVGPRPHAAGSRAENQLFWDIDQRYWHRHAIKPGLTGLAQVRGFRGATEKRQDLEHRLQADLDYRANWSLWNDIQIVFKTFRVLVHRNAY